MTNEINTQWTAEQLSAIGTHDRSLLVSAGAGSGKTTVLTERIMRKITAEENPLSISDFLIVSFNKASAADLKKKISKELRRLIVADKTRSDHLKQQLVLINRANISTMHAFCLQVIKENPDRLSLPATFRIGSETEAKIIKKSVFDSVFELFYSGRNDFYKDYDFTYNDFLYTVENFLGKKINDNSFDIMIKIHSKLQNYADKYAFLNAQIELNRELAALSGEDDREFFNTAYGHGVYSYILDFHSYFSDNYTQIYESVNYSPDLKKKFEKKITSCLDYLDEIKTIAANKCSYKELSLCLMNINKGRLTGVRGIEEDLNHALLTAVDKRLGYAFDKITSLFTYKFSTLQRFAADYEKNTRVIIAVLKLFEAELLKEKMRLKVFDFSDLERFAFELLLNKDANGAYSPSPIALSLRQKFKEIYIDEYQDTNDLQDAIFKAISSEDENHCGGNRFMVGDVKQSIYAFRGANSDIFESYADKFKLLDDDGDNGSPAKIFLSHNFRCDKNIIGFTNGIFKVLFNKKNKTIDYGECERLVFGKDPEKDKNFKVDFIFLEKEAANSLAVRKDGVEESRSEDIDYKEAEYVALKIKNMILQSENNDSESEPLKYSEVAVLTRNNTKTPYFTAAFKKYDIPFISDDSDSFLSCPESLLFLSLLHTVNNPYNEIYLASALKSPIFSFTLNKLIKIKLWNEDAELKRKNLYICLQNYYNYFSENDNAHGFFYDGEIVEDIKNFNEKLRIWREKARFLTADKFIWYLFKQTDILAIISKEKEAVRRKENLMLFLEHARAFELSSYRGLFNFLLYLENLRINNDDVKKTKKIAETANAVRIMSVHKSKGLEFPVCFIVNCADTINFKDSTNDPVISEKLGIYYRIKSEDMPAAFNTPMRALAANELKTKAINEEARILYVALTRAKNKLIITNTVKNKDDTLSQNYEPVSSFSNLSLSLTSKMGKTKISTEISYTDLFCKILFDYQGGVRLSSCAECGTIGKAELRAMAKDLINPDEKMSSEQENGAPQTIIDLEKAAKHKEGLAAIYEGKYKYSALSSIPAKVSVSELTPSPISAAPLPDFINETREKTDFSPAEAGTAAHICMQFIDFESAHANGSEYEAGRLHDMGFLTKSQFDLLDFTLLDRFFKSPLYEELKSARELYREKRFNLMTDIKDYEYFGEQSDICNLPDNEFVLIQGVIDLFYIDRQGKLVVADFKTDRVKKSGGEEELIRRYKTQLRLYSRAAEEMTGIKSSKAVIFSFHLDKTIDVPLDY